VIEVYDDYRQSLMIISTFCMARVNTATSFAFRLVYCLCGQKPMLEKRAADGGCLRESCVILKTIECDTCSCMAKHYVGNEVAIF